jgi:recombination protein RecA
MAMAQLEGQIGDKHVAVGANLLTAFVSQCIYGAKKKDSTTPNQTAVIGVNQFRDDIGGWSPQGKPKRAYGAWAFRYAKLLDIELSASTRISDGSGETKVEYGQLTKYKVAKGKAGCCGGGVGSFDFYKRDSPDGTIKAGCIDIGKEYRITGVRNGVITRKGPKFEYDGDKYGMAEFSALIREDLPFRAKVRADIFAAAGIGIEGVLNELTED